MADDAVTRLGWLLRRHAPLVLMCIVLLAALGAVLQPPDEADVYRAEALVVAGDVEALRVEHLPRMASTVFSGGSVARNAVQIGDLPFDPDELIPTHASVEPIEGTFLVRVIGTSSEPELAARIANAAAETLTEELNKVGSTVARFVVQEHAAVPPKPEQDGRSNLMLLGALAGLVLGLGLVALVATFRRPILGVAQLREQLDDPVVMGPSISPPGTSIDPVRTPGLAVLVDRLSRNGDATCAFVSARGDGRWRSQTALAVALSLAERSPVTLVASGERGSASLYRRALSNRDAGLVKHLTLVDAVEEAHPGSRVVIDGPSAGVYDVPQLLPADAVVLLVVPQGSSEGAIEEVLRQFAPGEVTLVLFIPPAARWRRLVARRASDHRSTTSRPGKRAERGTDGGPSSWEGRRPS